MNTIILSFLVIIFVATSHAGVGGKAGGQVGFKGSSKMGSQQVKSPYGLHGLGNEHEYTRTNPSTRSKEKLPPKSGRNITTLQIVYILTIIMSLGFVGYYFIQFYPFICSKESKYDVMSRSSVTPTQSREFENESTSSATKSTNASYSYEHDV